MPKAKRAKRGGGSKGAVVAAAVDEFVGWAAKAPKVRTATAIALALGVKQPSVSDWLNGKSRPETHLRMAIEALTDGDVPADHWMTVEERKLVQSTAPMGSAA